MHEKAGERSPEVRRIENATGSKDFPLVFASKRGYFSVRNLHRKAGEFNDYARLFHENDSPTGAGHCESSEAQ
jgi:hypothetical protein